MSETPIAPPVLNENPYNSLKPPRIADLTASAEQKKDPHELNYAPEKLYSEKSLAIVRRIRQAVTSNWEGYVTGQGEFPKTGKTIQAVLLEVARNEFGDTRVLNRNLLLLA